MKGVERPGFAAFTEGPSVKAGGGNAAMSTGVQRRSKAMLKDGKRRLKTLKGDERRLQALNGDVLRRSKGVKRR